ncbi:MAG: GNAT family N-acetyltransferase, partial [Pseudomonadota bacterium]
RNSFDDGAVELLCACAGDAPFGYLYNFVKNRQVLYNAGGFVLRPDNRYKPGLLTQALAIADHLARDAEVYDFMAGGDRYKFNLGETGPTLVGAALQRSTPFLRLERAARALKRRWLDKRKRA